MISVRVIHVAHLIQDSKKIIVSVAILKVYPHVLYIASSQVDCACFCGNRPRVERHIVLHLHRLLLEGASLETEQLDALLVPLERVETLG